MKSARVGVFAPQNLAYSTNLGSFWRAGLPGYAIGSVSWSELQETMGGQVERKAFGLRGSLGGSEGGWEAGKDAVFKRHGLGLKKLGTGIQPPRNLTEVIIQRVLI